MVPHKKDIGFWKNLGHMRVSQLLGIEAPLAVLLGGGGCTALLHVTKVPDRVVVAGDFLSLIGALLGVVVAAFALVISMFSDSYLLVLQKHPDGVRAFLSPFVVNTGVQIGVIIGTVAYRASSGHLPKLLEKCSFVFLGVLFTFALLNIMALTRNSLAHGLTRAAAAELGELEEKAKRRRPLS
jgi:hypothetical protein